MKCAVIFGGTGFIGAFFARHLLDHDSFNKIYVLDLQSPTEKESIFRQTQLTNDDRIIFVRADVRKSLIWFQPGETINLIANFAAIHREPGHQDQEYFETNLLGAENICAWAEFVSCEQIVFTSSISPYGLSEKSRDEGSLPVPVTAYGSSKLVAEKIHCMWQAADNTKRKLLIVRPGVVFGPGEGGNVTRLIKAVARRYFFYMGNHQTRKAGIYVKELCNAMSWGIEHQHLIDKNLVTFNATMNPGPSIQEYVDEICSQLNIRRINLGVPHTVLLVGAWLIECLARPLKIKHPFSPVRIKKLVRSNNILPSYLINNTYNYKYDLKSALEDWRKDCPKEWR